MTCPPGNPDVPGGGGVSRGRPGGEREQRTGGRPCWSTGGRPCQGPGPCREDDQRVTIQSPPSNFVIVSLALPTDIYKQTVMVIDH